jgi:hypothetical protein
VPGVGNLPALPRLWARFEWRVVGKVMSERKGLLVNFATFVPNLSLRGARVDDKRVSVKTTLATKRAFLGPRPQAGIFFRSVNSEIPSCRLRIRNGQ